MANRFRNERIEIKLTKEEKEIFEKKMKLENCLLWKGGREVTTSYPNIFFELA